MSVAALTACVTLGLMLPTLVYRPVSATPAGGILDIFVRPGFYLTDLAALAVILLGLAGLRSAGRLRTQGNLVAPLLALAGLALLVAPVALSPVVAAYTALRWVMAAALFVALVGSDLPARGLLAGLLAGVAINAALAVGQAILQTPLGLPGELTLPRSTAGAAVIGAERWLRPYGLTFHPNVLGGFLVVGLLALLPRVSGLSARLLWWLCWAALLLTVSRSAWIACALTLPALAGWLFIRSRDLRRPLIISAAGSVLIASLFVAALRPVVAERLTVGEVSPGAPADATGRSVSERLALQSVALGVIRSRPLTGVGAGNAPLAVRSAAVDAAPQPVHNVPLLLAAEVGVIGGALWIWLSLAPLAIVLARWRSRGPQPVPAKPDPLPVAFALAWFALGTIGLFDFYPWGLESGRLLSVVTLALFARTFTET